MPISLSENDETDSFITKLFDYSFMKTIVIIIIILLKLGWEICLEMRHYHLIFNDVQIIIIFIITDDCWNLNALVNNLPQNVFSWVMLQKSESGGTASKLLSWYALSACCNISKNFEIKNK